MPSVEERRRIAITGVGVVSAIGTTPTEMLGALGQGRSGLTDHPFPGHEAFSHCRCAPIKEDSWLASIPNPKLVKLMNREAQMAAAAAVSAFSDACLNGHYARERTSLYLGIGLTSVHMEELMPVLAKSFDPSGRFSPKRFGESGLAACNPLLSFKILPNMALCYISMLLGIQGDNLAFTPWPGNAMQAVIAGARSILWGDSDCALVGGCDSKTNAIGFLTFQQLGLLSPIPQRRNPGLFPGEGAAVLVLEELESARKRGAPLYAELSRFAEESDPHSPTLYPQDTGILQKTMKAALGGEIPDAAVVSIGTHPVGDSNEIEALFSLFHTPPPVVSFRPYLGHPLAADPALSLAIAASALRQGARIPQIQWPATASGHPVNSLAHRLSDPLGSILINSVDLGPVKTSLLLRRVS